MNIKMKIGLVISVLLYAYVIVFSLYQIFTGTSTLMDSQFIGYVVSFTSLMALAIYMVTTFRIKQRYVIIAFILAFAGMILTNGNALYEDNVMITFGYTPFEFVLLGFSFVAIYFWSDDERLISVIVYALYFLSTIMALVGAVTYSYQFEHYVALGLLANCIVVFGILYSIMNETHYKYKEVNHV